MNAVDTNLIRTMWCTWTCHFYLQQQPKVKFLIFFNLTPNWSFNLIIFKFKIPNLTAILMILEHVPNIERETERKPPKLLLWFIGVGFGLSSTFSQLGKLQTTYSIYTAFISSLPLIALVRNLFLIWIFENYLKLNLWKYEF